jgi:hypothetical protein
MDGPTLQGLLYAGMAIEAGLTGYQFNLFRPSGAVMSLSGPPLLTLPATISVRRGSTTPQNYGKSNWVAVVDGRLTAPGDYLVEVQPSQPLQPVRTFFIASMVPGLDVQAVLCNRTVDILREQADPIVGSVGYGGDVAANEISIMSGFPASMLAGTKGERADDGLPDAVRQPWYVVMMPAIAGVEILTDDIATDNLGHRYKVSSAELTDLGWRLSVALAEA